MFYIILRFILSSLKIAETTNEMHMVHAKM